MRTNIAKLLIIMILLSSILTPLAASDAEAVRLPSNVVNIYEDEKGFKLMVDGEPFEVKGVVWSYTPIGENYTYDLWSESDEFIKNMIDADAKLMKEAGVNAIRVFSMVPPKWITYLYRKYGIYTIVNDMFGRYGVSARGIWYPRTDYSDVYSREVIKEEALKTVETYKDVPGVLMFLFGNENNYGLEWDSAEIENLPVGQRMETRAAYLYDLFEEVISEAREMDPDHPMGLVNGDIQYINLIRELVPSLQVLGVNTYRGGKAYDLFFRSIDQLGVPFVYTEFGADAYNVVTEQEDQYSQADYILDQWQELYANSYGKGSYGNALGGFVFEWLDEWWKHGLEENLLLHDTTGTWTNSGYEADAHPERDNMNEEWFGIVGQSLRTDNGIAKRLPRAAYYLLKDVWELSLYDSTDAQVEEYFDTIDPMAYIGAGSSRAEQEQILQEAFTIESMSARIAGTMSGDQDDFTGDFRTDTEIRYGQELDLTIGITPFEDFSGSVEIRMWNDPILSQFRDPAEYTTYDDDTGEVTDHIAIYSGEFLYEQPAFDLSGFYRTGHATWVEHGDPFGLMPEAWDRYGMDSDGSEAPFGLELEGKDALEGLYLAVGPELYWGALPQAALNYYQEYSNWDFGLMYREQFASTDDAYPGREPGRKASISASYDMGPYFYTEAAVLHAGAEKLGEAYDYPVYVGNGAGLSGSDYDIENSEISLLDTFGFKGLIGTKILRYSNIYARYTHMGLVADAEPLTSYTSMQTADSGSGNRQQIDLGGLFVVNDLTLETELRYRRPLSGSMISVGSYSPRSLMSDPFAVYWNRETIEGELTLTYDPEGATYFHNWDGYDRETADIAGALSIVYIPYAGATDSSVYKNEAGDWVAFASGLPAAYNLWRVSGKMIANPLPDLRIIATAEIGHDQSTGEDTRIVNYISGGLDARYRQLMFSSYVALSAWGPEVWQRQFNITYPVQWGADLSYGFGEPSFLDSERRVGIRTEGRAYDTNSADDEPNSGFDMAVSLYVTMGY